MKAFAIILLLSLIVCALTALRTSDNSGSENHNITDQETADGNPGRYRTKLARMGLCHRGGSDCSTRCTNEGHYRGCCWIDTFCVCQVFPSRWFNACVEATSSTAMNSYDSN